MDPFQWALHLILRMEGDHSHDPEGGDTVWGISRTYHPYEPWPPSKERVEQIYKEEYWDAFLCGQLPPLVGIALFDAIVNMPQHEAVQYLQRALRVEPDGIVGHDTIQAAKRRAPWETIALFFSERALHYAARSRPEYKRGHIARLFRVQKALTVAAEDF